MSQQDARRITQADHVLSRFESVAHASKVTGIPEQTWRNWRRRGWITQENHLTILERGRRAGVSISPADFSHHLTEWLLSKAA